MKKNQKRLMTLLICLCLMIGLLPVTVLAATPEVTFGNAWRNTRTEAQVEFTSDTTGAYYYAVTDPSVSTTAPDIDTSGPGTPCTANETVTVMVKDVPTTSQCTFWLIVKGEDGTTSALTETTIPEWDWWTLDGEGILHIESDKGLTNWNNWLNDQDLFYQMWYKQSVVGVHLWKDVTEVNGGSFPANEYPDLAAYTVEDGNTSFSTENGVLYDTEKTRLIAYPGGKADTDFTISDAVFSIESKAFYGNTKLKNVICDEVMVGPQAFYNAAIENFSATGIVRIDESAFYGCRKLTAVRYTGELFYSFNIGASAFQDCSSLTQFPFNKISSTGSAVFKNCTSLTKVEFPDIIGNSMFAGCTGLTEITINANVIEIGANAFDGCTNLVSVIFESATPPEIADSPFKPVSENFRIQVPEGSEAAYIEALGEDMAPYILPSGTQFYPLYVNGERIRSDKLEIPCDTGTAVFDPDTNTLTLTDAQITEYGGQYGYKGAINSGLENLTIVLVGNNTIDTEGDSIDTAMDCNLVIKGDGTLTTNTQLDLGREPSLIYDGKNDSGDLTIDGATVNVGTYLFVHHNITFENGAKVNVTGTLTANHQSTLTVNGAETIVTANGLSMGNGTQSGQTECKLVINDGNLTLKDGVSFPYPEDGDTAKYAIRFDPKEVGKIELNGGTFITESNCKVTNAPVENITVADTLDIQNGSWEEGNLKIIPHQHEMTLIPEKPATCTETGTKAYYICSQCNKAFEDEKGVNEIKDLDTWKIIPATGHNPSSEWSSDATGHWHACQNTGCTEKIDFAEHTPDHQGHATEEYAIKCTECGYVIEEQLSHTHVFDQEVATDAYKATDATCQARATYYKSCKCGEKGTETFEYGELGDHISTGANVATCQHKAVCDICNVEYGELADHTWTPATCTTPKTCSVCGTTEGDALGHTEGTEWKSDADNHWHVCTAAGCGVTIESSKAAHDFKWVTDKEATATEKGSKHEECSVCGYRKAAVEIPATGTPAETGTSEGASSPQTGNPGDLNLWIAVMVVSAGALSAVAIRRKNKAEKNR